MNRFTHRPCDTRRIAIRPHNEVNWKIILELRVRHIPHRSIDPIVEQIFFHVFDDTDHLHPGKILADPDSFDLLAKRSFSRPRLTRQLFADHYDWWLAGAISLVDQPAFDQSHADRF